VIHLRETKTDFDQTRAVIGQLLISTNQLIGFNETGLGFAHMDHVVAAPMGGGAWGAPQFKIWPPRCPQLFFENICVRLAWAVCHGTW